MALWFWLAPWIGGRAGAIFACRGLLVVLFFRFLDTPGLGKDITISSVISVFLVRMGSWTVLTMSSESTLLLEQSGEMIEDGSWKNILRTAVDADIPLVDLNVD